MVKYIFSLIMIFSLIGLLSCQDREAIQTQKDVIAWVNGIPIHYTDFIDIWKENTGGEVLRSEEIEDLVGSILNHLIEARLILEEGKHLGIEVEDKEIEERIRSIKGELPDKGFQRSIIARYRSMDNWRNKLEKEILISKIVDEVISPYGVATEEDALNYYESHSTEFNRPERFRASQIVVRSDEEAKDLLARLRKGEDFQELANRYSLSPDRENGGDLGFFAKGEMPEEFEEAIFSLSKGMVSQVVKSRYGYHIFKLVEKQQEELLSFSEVKDKIMSKLSSERQDNAFAKWIEELKDNSEIKTDTELLKSIILVDSR